MERRLLNRNQVGYFFFLSSLSPALRCSASVSDQIRCLRPSASPRPRIERRQYQKGFYSRNLQSETEKPYDWDHMMLHWDKDCRQETYYNVLGAREDASHDEIRAHYKAAVLNSHPDKAGTKQEFEQAHGRFLKIQKAWEVLGDAESRGIYDRELKAGRSELLVLADEVKLEEMTLDDSGDAMELVYPCRCGDNFCITSDELEEMGILLLGERGSEILEATSAPVSITVPCSSCSLKICLTINSNS